MNPSQGPKPLPMPPERAILRQTPKKKTEVDDLKEKCEHLNNEVIEKKKVIVALEEEKERINEEFEKSVKGNNELLETIEKMEQRFHLKNKEFQKKFNDKLQELEEKGNAMLVRDEQFKQQKKELEQQLKEQKTESEKTMVETKENSEKEREENERKLKTQLEELREQVKNQEKQVKKDENEELVVASEISSVPVLEYKKIQGQIGLEGPLFEIKMLALILIRVINTGQPFFLASNMAEANPFDDIILRTKSEKEDKWTTWLVQLKHKRGDNRTVGYSQVLSVTDKNYSLLTFCKSFSEIRTRYGNLDNDWPWRGEFDEFRFVLYTNVKTDASFSISEDENVNDSPDYILISNEDGTVYSFNADTLLLKYFKEFVEFVNLLQTLLTNLTIGDISSQIIDCLTNAVISESNKELMSVKNKLLSHVTQEIMNLSQSDHLTKISKILSQIIVNMSAVQDLNTYKLFSRQFYFYTDQSKESEMEALIVRELREACTASDESELKHLYTHLFDSVHTWWKQDESGKDSKGIWLTESCTIWKSLISVRINQFLTLPTLVDVEGVDINFTPESCDAILKEIQKTQRLNILSKDGTVPWIATRVYQALSRRDQNKYIFTTPEALLKRHREMLALWRHKICQGLILYCEGSVSEAHATEISFHLQERMTCQEELKIVLISLKKNNLSNILKSYFTRTKYDFFWSDLKVESQNKLLEHVKCRFQGNEISLTALLGDDIEQINHQLQGNGITSMMNSELCIGRVLDQPVDYFIPRRLKRDNKEFSITSLKDVDERVTLLIAEPGMGKTTLMTHLAHETKATDKNTWIIRINLNDCSSYLANLRADHINTGIAIRFLFHFARNTEFAVEETIFENRLRHSGKAVVIIDSVDEVFPFYEQVVCNLLKHLLDTKIEYIWVTSRRVAKESLGSILGVKAFSLVALSIEDQKNFFIMFWKKKNLGLDRLNEFVKAVFHLLQRSMIGKKLVSEIPQQTRMLAEYFESYLDEFILSGKSDLPTRINIHNLFDSFVKKILKIYSEEKRLDNKFNTAVINDRFSLDQFIEEIHMRAALMTVFQGEEYSQFLADDHLQEHAMRSLEKTGIIDRIDNGKPHFVHRTFAEFFTSSWMSKNQALQAPLKMIMFESRFHTVRTFYDLKIADEHPLHRAVINRDIDNFKRFLSQGINVNIVDSVGRTALHLTVAYCGSENDSDYVEMTKCLLEHNAEITTQDRLLQWRPLQYADEAEAWQDAGMILRAGGDVGDLKHTKVVVKPEVYDHFILFLKQENQNLEELLFRSAEHGDLKVVRFLVDCCGANIGCRGINGSTPMHASASGGHVDVMSFLHQRHAQWNVLDDNNSTPLHYATKKQGNVTAVTLLVEKGLSIDARNVNDDSPLALAFQVEDSEVLEYFLKNGADVQTLKVDSESKRLLVPGKVDKYFEKQKAFKARRLQQMRLSLADQPYIVCTPFVTVPTCRTAIGIDMGATNTRAASKVNGRVFVIPDRNGKNFISSSVVIEDDALHIGIKGMNNTVFDVKSLLGRSFDDPAVKMYQTSWRVNLIEVEGKLVIKGGDETMFTPEKMCAKLLQKIVECAELRLGCVITDVVLTVPVSFNMAQQLAIVEAGNLAGLNVLRLISEPIAAALAYGLDKVQKRRLVLIYDFRRDGLEVTVIRVDESEITILNTEQHNQYRGTEFDHILTQYVKEQCSENEKFAFNDPSFLIQLKETIHYAKLELSFVENAIVNLKNPETNRVVTVELSRDDFDDRSRDFVMRTLETVKKVLGKVAVGVSKVDDVVLVGGASKVPIVKRVLQELFPHAILRDSIDPEEVLAHGAAVQADVITALFSHSSHD